MYFSLRENFITNVVSRDEKDLDTALKVTDVIMMINGCVETH